MLHPLTSVIAFARVFALSILLAGGALAQSSATEPLDYQAWETVAQRAELAVENGRASTDAMESLREQVTEWRQDFLDAQSVNKDRIETLQSQMAALGTPEEGTEEPAEIAARRQELTDQLARLSAPRRAAEEAYSRADGVIREIDALIRERQTDELLQSGPLPLNPVFWAPAIEDLVGSFTGIWNETAAALSSKARRSSAVAELPKVLVLVLIGVVLILRGRHWSVLAMNQLRQRVRRGTGAWRFVASLAQIVLPYIGIVTVVEGLFQTGLIGLRTTLVLDNVPLYALLLLFMIWLGGQLFARQPDEAILPVVGDRNAEARWYVTATAAVLIFTHLLSVLAAYDDYSDATRAVLGFPLLLVTSLMLFRIGQILRGQPAEHAQEDGAEEARQYRQRVSRFLGFAVLVVAIVGPLLAAAGFGTAAARAVFSSAATLVLFGLVLVLQHFVRQVYALITGSHESEDDSLIPVLIGFALVVVSMPALAMIWGARLATITEVWTRFQEGIEIGDSRISPGAFLTFVVLFAAGYMITRAIQGAMRTSILPRTKLDAGGRNAIVSGIGYIGIFVAALVAISSAGIDLSNLAIVAGALSVGIGFGLQNIVSNFVSGIILLIERPIAEGDWIEVGGKMGYVRGISVRSTRIETFDRTDVIVPNADLVSGMVTNWTRGKTVGRVIVPVGVAYGNDTREVEQVLLGIAREHPMVLLNPEPSVVFQGFGADSLDFEIRAILRDVNFVLSVKSDMNHEIAKRFAEEGIEIPYAQRDIWLRNPEVLAQTVAKGVEEAAAAAQKPEDEDGK